MIDFDGPGYYWAIQRDFTVKKGLVHTYKDKPRKDAKPEIIEIYSEESGACMDWERGINPAQFILLEKIPDRREEK